jgi:sugar O-acyltransferase (sialic acid O-acetyltransferase NeuD family)
MTERLSKKLVIIGAGGHATSVANAAKSAGFDICFFVDSGRKGLTLFGAPIIGNISEVAVSEYCFAIAVGDNAVRERIYLKILADYRLSFPVIAHSSAIVSYNTTIREGTVLMPGSIVGPNCTIGRFCFLSSMSSLDHDCEVSDFGSLAPGSITGGHVSIGLRSAISIGAVIKNDIIIGQDSVIGANSYVNRAVPANVIAYGSPAKIIRSRNPGDPYFK